MSNTLFHHLVEISDGKGIIKDDPVFKVVEVPVVAESGSEIVTKSGRYDRFIVLKKEHRDHYDCLDKETISLQSNDSCWGSRISYSLYSTSRRPAKAIKKAIEKAITKKFGFFTQGLDLSIIKE